jgi:hypothetical protein
MSAGNNYTRNYDTVNRRYNGPGYNGQNLAA